MLRNQRVRVRFGVTLALASLPPSGAIGVAHLRAQEVPTGVATELVDRAIRQRLDVSAAEGGARSTPSPPAAVEGGNLPTRLAAVWFLIPAAVALVIWRRRRTLRGASGAPSVGIGVGPDDVPGAGAARDRADVVRVRASGAPSDTAAKPKEELAIPAHVLSILERQAARRAEASAAEPPAGHSGGAVQPVGFDVLVPRYDPWKES